MILGLDSAPNRTGWALVDRTGPREQLVAYGLLESVDGPAVKRFVTACAERRKDIGLVAIEDAYLDKNVDTVKVLCRLIGRWEQEFDAAGIPTRLVMPDVWQMGILGGGLIHRGTQRAERKRAAIIWAKSTYGRTLRPDEADATAIATWQARQLALAKLCRPSRRRAPGPRAE